MTQRRRLERLMEKEEKIDKELDGDGVEIKQSR